MKIVIDASSAFVMLGAPERVAPFLAVATDLLAPELIVAELLNARWKVMRAGAVAPTVDNLLGLVARLRFVESTAYGADAAALAERLDHPVYDCLYAVIAARQTARLLTADRRFATKLSGEEIDIALL